VEAAIERDMGALARSGERLQEADTALDRAENVAPRLLARLPAVTLTPRRPGVTLDLAPSTAELASHHGALVQANADALGAKRGEQLTRSRRDALGAEYTRQRTSTGMRLTADLRAVGLADVAERLLPTTRPAKKSAKGAKAKPPSAEGNAAAPAVIPAINTRPSMAPAPPS